MSTGTHGVVRKRCHGDGCLMTATHGPSGEAVACWSHAGDFPMVAPLPSYQCAACGYFFDDNSICKCGCKETKPMTDEQRGIYRKYKIERTDGSSKKGGKHEACAYFVLDLEHDEFAVPALQAYAEACRARFPALSEDIGHIVEVASRTTFGMFGPQTGNDAAVDLMDRDAASRKR